MKKLSLVSAVFFIGILTLNAQSIKVDMIAATDTLFFEMDPLTEEVSNKVNFKLVKGNKFKFGQVNMKAHKINPFNLPKIYLNNKEMNTGIYFPNLDQDAIFTYKTLKNDTSIFNIKSPIGENAAVLNFVFSKKDLVEGDNEIKITVTNKQNQSALAITDLKLFLRAQLNIDNIIEQVPAEFPGGQKGWANYLENNLNTDVPIKNGALPGRYQVIVTFIIDKEGNVTEVAAENNPGYGTMEEALRVIQNGPKWTPASENGKKVIYRQRQAIVFGVSN
jgi:hypothetical protein